MAPFLFAGFGRWSGNPDPVLGSDREERDFRRSPVNRARDSDRLGHFSIVVRPSGRRRARCEASTAHTWFSLAKAWSGGAGASRPVSFFGTAIGVWCPATTPRSFGIGRCVAPG
jgi:hypothetical protein